MLRLLEAEEECVDNLRGFKQKNLFTEYYAALEVIRQAERLDLIVLYPRIQEDSLSIRNRLNTAERFFTFKEQLRNAIEENLKDHIVRYLHKIKDLRKEHKTLFNKEDFCLQEETEGKESLKKIEAESLIISPLIAELQRFTAEKEVDLSSKQLQS